MSDSCFLAWESRSGVWVVPKYPGECLAEQSRVALRDKRRVGTIKFAQRSLGEIHDETCWLDSRKLTSIRDKPIPIMLIT